MWGCIQGQAQKENQLKNQEACGLKLVLENGLQIEIGNSGSADLHACVTLHWNWSAVQASKEFCYSRGGPFFNFSHIFPHFSLSKTNPIWLCHFFFFNQWLFCCYQISERGCSQPLLLLVQSWYCQFPCYFKAGSKLWPNSGARKMWIHHKYQIRRHLDLKDTTTRIPAVHGMFSWVCNS